MNEQKSEVAQLLHRIILEYEAATRGLTGLSAGSAMHTFITARLERIGAYHEQLASLVGETRATQLVIELEELPPEENPPDWSSESWAGHVRPLFRIRAW